MPSRIEMTTSTRTISISLFFLSREPNSSLSLCLLSFAEFVNVLGMHNCFVLHLQSLHYKGPLESTFIHDFKLLVRTFQCFPNTFLPAPIHSWWHRRMVSRVRWAAPWWQAGHHFKRLASPGSTSLKMIKLWLLWTAEFQCTDRRKVDEHVEDELIESEIMETFVPHREPSVLPHHDYITLSEVEEVDGRQY